MVGAHATLAAAVSGEPESKLRAIPPTQRLLAGPGADALRAVLGEDALRAEVRAALESLRAGLLDGSLPADRDALAAHVDGVLAARARAGSKRNLRPVINGTGVVLHTNLGRAPLGAAVLEEVRAACAGYTPLEYDLAEGARGHRDRIVQALLVSLTGAQDAIVVNNCAAAVLLACTAFAAGREVIVSRGELVEIGGGFRIPDVVASCGATLVEVGTTNKTRAADFERAITDRTAALLSVHPSNFALVGFTQRASREELAALARQRSVLLLEDLGSGALFDLQRYGLPHEPTVQDAVRGGAHVVMFSGDKLLGGPQAGILVGEREPIERLRRHPLMRALRPGRIVLAALEATLARYANGTFVSEIPAIRAMTESVESVRRRAEQLRSRVIDAGARGWHIEVRPSVARVGGGTLPVAEIPSAAVAIEGDTPSAVVALERALRTSPELPVIGRITAGALWLDARTIADDELVATAAALARALHEPHNEAELRSSLTPQAHAAPPGVGPDPTHDES